jgi:hypothetical protein
VVQNGGNANLAVQEYRIGQAGAGGTSDGNTGAEGRAQDTYTIN